MLRDHVRVALGLRGLCVRDLSVEAVLLTVCEPVMLPVPDGASVKDWVQVAEVEAVRTPESEGVREAVAVVAEELWEGVGLPTADRLAVMEVVREPVAEARGVVVAESERVRVGLVVELMSSDADPDTLGLAVRDSERLPVRLKVTVDPGVREREAVAEGLWEALGALWVRVGDGEWDEVHDGLPLPVRVGIVPVRVSAAVLEAVNEGERVVVWEQVREPVATELIEAVEV